MRIGGTLGPSTICRASTTLTSEPSSVAGTSEGRLPCSNDVGSYVMGAPVRRSWSHVGGAPPEPLTLDEVDEVDEVGVESQHIAVFDELYDLVHRGKPLAQAFVDRLNAVDRELRPRLIEHNAAVKSAALTALRTDQDPG